MGLGGKDWIVIVLVVLLLLGGREIPELMKGLGSGLNELKKATKDDNKSEATESTSDKKEN